MLNLHTSINAQIAKLKSEAEELMARRKQLRAPDKPTEMDSEFETESDAPFELHLEDFAATLEAKLGGLTEAAQDGIHKHPLIAIAAAIGIGIIIGRLTKVQE